MANWESIKQTIKDIIKPNGIRMISGSSLQSVLLDIATAASESTLSDGSVTTNKLADGSVTANKLATGLLKATAPNANLLMNSRFLNSSKNWTLSNSEIIADLHEEGVNGVKVRGEIAQTVTLNPGYYTLSFVLTTSIFNPAYLYLEGSSAYIMGNNFGMEEDYEGLPLPDSYDPRVCEVYIEVQNLQEDVTIYFFTEEGEFNISKIKLEVGETATPYVMNEKEYADVYTFAKKSEISGGGGTEVIAPNANLLLNTKFYSFDNWDVSNAEIESYAVRLFENGSIQQQVSLVDGQAYTLSFLSRGIDGGVGGVVIGADIEDYTTSWGEDSEYFPQTTEFTQHYLSFIAVGDQNSFLEFYHSEGGDVYIKDIKLEVGSKVTPYTLNIADYADAYTYAKKSEISGGGGTSGIINGGIVNITKHGIITPEINSMDYGAVALCIIGDSNGSYPSTETRVNVYSGYTILTNYFFSSDARGANVGDLLLITKRHLLGSTIFATRIIPLNDAKVATDEYNGTEGVMTVWDKSRVNKVDGIEWTANDTRAWLNGVVNTDLRKTKYGYGTDLDTCLKTGALSYTNATINDITANWTVFIDCTVDGDGGGYFHLIQTAVCRDEGENYGKMFKRLGYYIEGEAASFLPWKLAAS